MARQSAVAIAEDEARSAVVSAEDEVSRTKCALTRANDEYGKANAAFEKEAAEVLGILVEDYPESYWTAQERREKAFAKLIEAEDAHDAACEQRDAAKEAEVDAVHAAALVELRRQQRRGAAQYHASA